MDNCVDVTWKSNDSITWNQIHIAIKFFYKCIANKGISATRYEWSDIKRFAASQSV
jgi:hypothetical protein